MRKPNEPLLTFAEAARQLDRKPDPSGSYKNAGRVLRRQVALRERELKRNIALRDGRGRLWKISLSSLWKAFPELQPHRIDRSANHLKSLFEHAQDELLDSASQRFATDLSDMRNRIVDLERLLRSLVRHLKKSGII